MDFDITYTSNIISVYLKAKKKMNLSLLHPFRIREWNQQVGIL